MRLGDTIHVEGRIAELRPAPTTPAWSRSRWNVVNQDEQIVCRARVDVLWQRDVAALDDRADPQRRTTSCRSRCDVLLEGKKLLITGVVTATRSRTRSRARPRRPARRWCSPAFGRARRMTERSATKLPEPPDVLELDVNSPEDIEAVADELRERWGRVDGVLHAIAFAPEDALGGNFLDTPAESAELAFQTSAYSLKALAAGLAACTPRRAASVVGLDFDASVAWPVYDWMGVAKAALEAISRYLARDLGPRGVRVNLVSAGPLGTLAARGIPGFGDLADRLAAAGAAGLGHRRSGAGRRSDPVPAQRPGARRDRRDPARRRRLPRDGHRAGAGRRGGCCMRPPSSSPARPASSAWRSSRGCSSRATARSSRSCARATMSPPRERIDARARPAVARPGARTATASARSPAT